MQTIPVPLLDLQAQYATIRDQTRAAIDRVCESQYFINGPEVEALEREVAAYSGCAYGVGVSSGTDALLVALMALDITAGDEVITPAYSFFATAGSVARLGAVPVYVDIDPLTFNMDPTQLEAAITPRTKAIIPVHLYGQMADMDAVMAVAQRHNLPVIEDAAQAIGAARGGKRAGSIGIMGCFSFYPTKNLGAFGDAGLVTTNDAALAARLKLLRGHGMQPRYYHKEVGGNFRLDALQAAVLRVKLPFLDGWSAARQRNAAIYRRLFAEAGLVDAGLGLPLEVPDARHIYNQFVIRTDRRATLIETFTQRQIGYEIYYPVPLHLQECFAAAGYRVGDMPESERAAEQTLALPIYPELREEQIAAVVDAVTACYA